MRMLSLGLTLLLVTLAVADEPPTAPPTTIPPPAPPAEQRTTVRGAAPDLLGRWLAVGAIELPTGKHRTVPGLWEVVRQDGQLVVTIRFANLPPEQQQAVDKANAAEEIWHPAPPDLAAVTAAWDALPAMDAKVATVATEVIAHDAFDEPLKTESVSKDALFVVRQVENFLPTAAPTLKQVNVYSVTAAQPGGGYRGNFTLGIVAAAPFPIPITLNGTCELYRLDAGSRGLLARLLDLFSGCGR